MEKWNYKTVVITGANSGIGYAILRKLAQVGMKAVGFDVRTENLEVSTKLIKLIFYNKTITKIHRDWLETFMEKFISNKSTFATTSR